jgi:hypothetical protein
MPKWHYDEPNIHDVKRGIIPQRERRERGRKKQVERDWLVVSVGRRWWPWRDREKHLDDPPRLRLETQHITEDDARRQVEKNKHWSYWLENRLYYCHRSVYQRMKTLWE